MRHFVIAIDGPAGAGKGTIARLVAEKLNFLYVDTGAMYRAITLKAIKTNTPLDNKEKLAEMAKNTSIELSYQSPQYKVIMDGEDVSEQIRNEEVTRNTHFIASTLEIRKILWNMQKAYRKTHDIVMEGRDIGSIVFPDAELKIYLDASVEKRAKRRYIQLKEAGHPADIEEIKKDIIERDEKDKNRTISPLKRLPSSVYIDSSEMTIEEEVEKIVDIALKKLR